MKKSFFMRKVMPAVLSALMAFTMLPVMKTQAAEISNTPYDQYGRIKVVGNQLVSESGTAIQLKGMSTFGLQWGDGNWVLNDAAFDALAMDWKCDIVRLAMYVAEDGYASHPQELLNSVEQGIQLATERGMYVIVDWHILNPGNPNESVYLNAGKDLACYADIRNAHPDYNGPQLFFAYLSQKYGSQGNVLFETGNEPNTLQSDSDWQNTIQPYHQNVVNAIRAYDSDSNPNVVICGTGNWDQILTQPISKPVEDPSAGLAGGNRQIMYTVHFYAGTHDTNGSRWIEDMVVSCLNAGLPVFCTEWGVSNADGNGGVFTDNASRWLQFFADHKISWCAWSLARKNESSAAMLTSTPASPSDNNGDGIPDWTSSQLSEAGNYLRGKISEGKDSQSTLGPANQLLGEVDEAAIRSFVERLYTLVLNRGSDASGIDYWANEIITGAQNGGDVAKGFITSPEFTNRGLSSGDFLTILYNTFFNRAPDQGGYDYWMGRLNSGASQLDVVNGFINSFEWADICAGYGIQSGGTPTSGMVAFAKRMYTTALSRDAEDAGLRYWVGQLQSGTETGNSIARFFFLSQEITNANLSNDEYVNRLYRTFFDREGDASGKSYWLSQLNSGVSRESVLNGFVISDEFGAVCRRYGIRRM